MTLDENQLARRFRAGEPGSFDTLYREYGTRIYRFCHRLCRNATCAEDLTQEVFLAAYQGAERFEGRSSLATWLYRIALYRWRNLRSTRQWDTIAWEDSPLPSAPDPAQSGMQRIALDNALASLSEPVREAFLLVKGEGFLCREAAEILGIPEGTLKYRVYTAVTQLQRLLQTEEDGVSEQPPLTAIPAKEIVR